MNSQPLQFSLLQQLANECLHGDAYVLSGFLAVLIESVGPYKVTPAYPEA